MTASIRILTSTSLDSNPSLLLVSPSGSKTLINCGEGCQRSFLESASSSAFGVGALRVSSVNRICLTHIGHDASGGLPGMILTTADAAENSARSFEQISARSNTNGGADSFSSVSVETQKNNASLPQQQQQQSGRSPGEVNLKRKGAPMKRKPEDEMLPGLEIVGPQGTKAFLHSLRHFMRRDRFKINAYEGAYDNSILKTSDDNGNNSSESFDVRRINKKSKRKKSKLDEQDVEFIVKSIPITYDEYSSHDEKNHSFFTKENKTVAVGKQPILSHKKYAMSYLFKTPPILGKFLIDRARALNIPPGPLYAQLKSGKNVTFTDPTTGEQRTVTSEEVVAKGIPGVVAAVIYCPRVETLAKLSEETMLRNLEINDNEGGNSKQSNESNGGSGRIQLDVMVHITPKFVFDDPAYQVWCKRFGREVDHIILHAAENLEVRASEENPSPFVSAVRGAIKRSYLHDGIFPALRPDLSEKEKRHEFIETDENMQSNNSYENGDGADSDALRIIKGCPMMEYLLIPRSKRGLNELTLNSPFSVDELEIFKEEVGRRGGIKLAQNIASSYLGNRKNHDLGANNTQSNDLAELIFTGTGSALPCKHRNVTGMYVRMNNGNSMLLDVGEGTVGQLLLSWKSILCSNIFSSGTSPISEYCSRLKSIKAVWISHPHADHHLGLLRLLSERNSICSPSDPIVLMAPPNLFAFLSEYRLICPEIDRSYIAVDCKSMIHGNRHPLGEKLYEDLGITNCMSVPVAHCPHSYAVVIDGTAFGRVAYSGDCRPSNRFANVGHGSDLLIHEATFEDGMEEEAVLKRHSTVGEAIDIAHRMKAKSLLLTHFSQRYPKIPPLTSKSIPVKIYAEKKVESSGAHKDGNQPETYNIPIVFAFDFMRLSPGTISLASQLTPALRLLYPSDNEDEMEQTEVTNFIRVDTDLAENKSIAKELMAIPGVFAAKGIL